MIGRNLGDLLGQLSACVMKEADRTDAARESEAIALARRLPLIHRTASRDRANNTWRSIQRERRIRAGKPGTDREKRLGSTQTAYFFFGHPAWPTGLVAFVLHALDDVLSHATFTPFDSGGLTGYMAPIDPKAPPLDEATKEMLLASHLGAGVDVQAFSGRFIATHLRDPEAYVTRPQKSEPDWEPFHGLRSTVGDRRSWTIEVQVDEDVPLDPASDRVSAIIVAGKDLLLDVDDDLLGLCTEAGTENDVQSAVIRHILKRP